MSYHKLLSNMRNGCRGKVSLILGRVTKIVRTSGGTVGDRTVHIVLCLRLSVS